MDNPFQKRVSEFLRDTEAFLAVVSAEPARTFFSPHGPSGKLYDRLVFVRGTPGSGKTTLARLFEFQTLSTLLRNRNLFSYASLLSTLTECGAIAQGNPTILASRLPLETDYRSIWDLPYPEEFKLSLTLGLIQSRAVLSWSRSLRQANVALESVEILPRPEAVAAADAVGGTSMIHVVERAKVIERLIYNLVAALIPPPLGTLTNEYSQAYQPFDVFDAVQYKTSEGENHKVRPVVILDDAHVLHPEQFSLVQRELTKREVLVGRWMLTRIDVMHPAAVFKALAAPAATTDLPGITSARETLDIMLQSEGSGRSEQRTRFRRMAKDMSNRYLKQMELFSSRKLESLGEILETEPEALPPSTVEKLRHELDVVQRRLKIAARRRALLMEEVAGYQPGKKHLPEDLQLAVLSILMHRYSNRIPEGSLFEDDRDLEPNRPLRVDQSLLDAARLHLLHKFDRPFFYGIDVLSDAGSENAEQFLHLAAILVEASATRIVRDRSPSLDARTQNKLLREKSHDIMRQWSFPKSDLVTTMVKQIASLCLTESLKPNAWIGSGANAYGVPQEEFDSLPQKQPELARTIQFALAYNALLLIPNYDCKNKHWCLFELGGVPILHYGLTLKRGGFIEGTVEKLNAMLTTT
jgi:hypothetical protein